MHTQQTRMCFLSLTHIHCEGFSALNLNCLYNIIISKDYFCILMSSSVKSRQEGHDGPEIAHLSLLTKHAPSSFPVTEFFIRHYPSSNTFEISIRQTFWPSFMSIGLKMWPLQCTKGFSKISSSDLILDLTITHYQTLLRHHQNKHSDQV